MCEYCKTNAGRTTAGKPCCELRRLAQAPRHVQADHGRNLMADERDALRPRLQAEIERLKQLRGMK